MACGVLAVFQRASVTSGRPDRGGSFDFVVGAVGEAQDEAVKLLGEFVLIVLTEKPEALAFAIDKRVENKLTLADKNCAGDLTVDGGNEANAAGMENESGGVALELQVGDGNGFVAEGDVAKILIGGIGVGAGRAGGLRESIWGEGENECDEDQQRRCTHKKAGAGEHIGLGPTCER